MDDNNTNISDSGFTIKDNFTLENPDAITIFKSEGKQDILKILIEKEMNIHDLKNALKLNPGTIKRHIDQLLEFNLIVQTREDENSWGVRMKYYRAVAKKFIIHFEWPDD